MICKIEIKDFNTIQINDEMYGGNGGNKYGFTKSNGENWFFEITTKYYREKVLLTEGAYVIIVLVVKSLINQGF